MRRILIFLYNQQSYIYKGILFLSAAIFIVYLFPNQQKFGFEYNQGTPWTYPTLYAPIDFAIIKTEEEIQKEKEEIRASAITFFRVDKNVKEKVEQQYVLRFKNFFPLPQGSKRYERQFLFGKTLLNEIYDKGVLPVNYVHKGGSKAALISDRTEIDLPFDQLLQLQELSNYLALQLPVTSQKYEKEFYNLFFEILEPNLFLDEAFTNQVLNNLYSQISPNRDVVAKGDLILSQNELIDQARFQKLFSLEQQYQSGATSNVNQKNFTLLGYFLLVVMVLLILLLFLYQSRPNIYQNNTKISFLLFNVVMMVLMSTVLLKFNSTYLYALPVCIFPLVIKAFFDARLGLFVHVLCVLLIGFIAPNSFEYIVLQILAGMVTLLSASELYKRANLFLSVFQVTLVYLLGYLCFVLIRVGDIKQVEVFVLGAFVVSGLLTLFVQPLIYLYEKIFQLDSDISLLELSDTNSGLFKALSDQAPGTFHHSLQVANLAEAAANAINANALLTRVGALYHDIGKITRPAFFSENQRGAVSPHDDILPLESAKIIIDHVLEGIQQGKKYKLPDRIIDFIRTHHGTSKVSYFYKKQLELDSETDEKLFIYPGPKPFSKETAIVMMADAVEAASKSLKNPTLEQLTQFVVKIIDSQVEDKQFIDANITLSEIEKVKKVLIDKLINVYHLRIAYPE